MALVDEVRVGLIGAGAVAARHAATLAGLPAVRLVAVADPMAERARALAAAHGARAYPDHRALLAATGFDAVYVCVPPFAHGEPERAVIEAGLPLFVEKPLARDLATAEELADRITERGLLTATGYHWRCLDTLKPARAALASAPPRLVLAAWLDRVPPPAWWVTRERSGGQTVEQTTHVLDLVRAFMGEPEEVWAVGGRTPRAAFPTADVDDVTAATLRFAGGAVGSVASTCLLRGTHRAGLELFGDGVSVALTETEVVIDAGDGPEVTVADGQAKVAVDRDFVEAVRGGPDRVRAPYAEALRTHRLACALARSAAAGRPVSLAGDQAAPGPAAGAGAGA